MNERKQWGFWILTALVVGNMVGSGIFMLPATLAKIASPLGVSLSWFITGLGVLMIALVFGSLSIRKPHLTSGPQSYAKNLFSNPLVGSFAGFNIVWGYWVANWIGNVAALTSLAGYLSAFFPVMNNPEILLSLGTFKMETGKFVTFLICTLILWGIHFLLVWNINQAGKINFVATAAKVIGFALFILVTLFAFQASKLGVFYQPIKGANGEVSGLFGQIHDASILTLWAFVGIESAVILSDRASSASDIKKSTIAGLAISVFIYFGMTLLTMGILTQEELRASQKPFVDALSVIIGHTGANIMAFLTVISLFGTLLGWILLSAEVPYQAAKTGIFPSYFNKVNKNNSPVRALSITNGMSQIFVFSTLSGAIGSVFSFLITAGTLAYLIPYLISSIYFLKLVITGDTYDTIQGSRRTDAIVAVLSLVYSIWIVIAGTADFWTFALGIGLYLASLILFPLFNRSKMIRKQT